MARYGLLHNGYLPHDHPPLRRRRTLFYNLGSRQRTRGKDTRGLLATLPSAPLWAHCARDMEYKIILAPLEHSDKYAMRLSIR